MNLRLICMVVVAVFSAGADDNECFIQDVYSQVRNVYVHPSRSAEDEFSSVRGGMGIDFDLDTGSAMTNFLHYCQTVSNNFDRIVNEWPSYETNDMVRFTTLSAVCYCGSTQYTNFIERVFTPTNLVGVARAKSAKNLLSPYGTPQAQFLLLGSDDPAIRGIINIIRSVAQANHMETTINNCDELLSGEAKRDYVEMRDAGAL